MAEKIILLGSTGSIGTQTLEVVRQHRDRLSVSALIANRSVEAVEAQAREFCVPCCAMFQEEAAKELRSRLKDTKTKVLSGMEGILEIMEQSDADTVLSAVVGMIGILPTIRAIECGKDIALANKETLVCAGHLIMPLARQKKVRILPVDSEHSAIFQSLNGEQKGRIEKILLTASGGPFRGKTKKELEQVTVKEALQHPNWSMGAKITVDSASLINKGLEVIEAVHLFDVNPDQIQVVVQPQSVLHSAVQFVDGSIIGQFGVPDMKLPIQYALFYPDRLPLQEKRLDLFSLKEMTFEEPDTETFRGLPLAISAIREGGSMPTVMNAANEMANRMFLEGRIRFLTIYHWIEQAMQPHKTIANPTLSQILEIEQETDAFLKELVP